MILSLKVKNLFLRSNKNILRKESEKEVLKKNKKKKINQNQLKLS